MNTQTKYRFTMDQRYALSGAIVLTVSVCVSFWYHINRAAGAEPLEFVFLLTLAAALMAVVVLYAMRARWGYLAGMLVSLTFFAALGKAFADDTIFFSLSFYNAIVMVVIAVAGGVFVVSLRAFRSALPRFWPAAIGMGLFICAVIGAVFGANATVQHIREWNAHLTLRTIERDLSELPSFDDRLEYLRSSGDFPAIAAAIVVDNEISWVGAFGEGVTEETVFNIGSIAKPITATAVLQLVERGTLDLNADVNKYLPFGIRHPNFPEVPITISMLLAHTSGIGSHHNPNYKSHSGRDVYLEWDRRHRGRSIYGEIISGGSDDDIGFGLFLEGYLTPGGEYFTPSSWNSNRPGETYAYTSVGFDLLGYIVEHVTGETYDDYLRRRVFTPLGMTRTARLSDAPPVSQAPPIERVYGVVWKSNVELPVYGTRRIGGGGVYSSAPDMARFLIAHSNEGRFGNTEILAPESIALMHAPRLAVRADIGMVASGYGWALFQQEPRYYWGTRFDYYGVQGHGGSDVGYRSKIYYAEQDTGSYGLVLLTNVANFFKPDELWIFSTYFMLENLLGVCRTLSGIFSRKAVY